MASRRQKQEQLNLWRLTQAGASVLLLSACAGNTSAGNSPPGAGSGAATSVGAAATRTTITMVSEGDARRFEPAALTVTRGTTVTWQHVSGSGHTGTTDRSKVKDGARVALPAGAAAWDSGTLSDGRTFTYTFEVPGTYQYVCVPHEDRGMVGTIVVSG
jgi:plastocyanin